MKIALALALAGLLLARGRVQDPAPDPTAPDPTAGGPTAGGPTAGGPTAGGPTAGGPTAGGPTAGGPAARAQLERTFAAAGLRVDLERGLVGLPARVLIRNDLLEYLLVGPAGASHESLLVTEVRPSLLNAALLALGVEPGRNAQWVAKDPPPSEEEQRAGVDPWDVAPPQGGGLFLYLAWREAGETFFFRLEDLLSNLDSGRSMRRHRWVYLGSRFVRMRPDEPEQFAADVEQNLICVAWFHEGNTLVTGALPECQYQEIWLPNAWLVPPSESPVQLVFARSEVALLDEAWRASLPEVVPSEGARGGR